MHNIMFYLCNMLSCWLVVVTFEAVSMKLTSRFKYSLTGKSLVSDPTSSARTYTPTSTHINIKKLNGKCL